MAYVLLNTEIGAESAVLKALRKIEGVQEAFNIYGVYDLIAKVKAESMEKLSDIVNNKIQLTRVHSKLTVVITDR